MLIAAAAVIALLQAAKPAAATPAPARPPAPWNGLRFDGVYVAVKADGTPDCAQAGKGPLTLSFAGRAAYPEGSDVTPSSDAEINLVSAGTKRLYTVRRAMGRTTDTPPVVALMIGRTERGGLGGSTWGSGTAMFEMAGDAMTVRFLNWSGNGGERDDFGKDKPKLTFCPGVKL